MVSSLDIPERCKLLYILPMDNMEVLSKLNKELKEAGCDWRIRAGKERKLNMVDSSGSKIGVISEERLRAIIKTLTTDHFICCA